mgnify:FL=1
MAEGLELLDDIGLILSVFILLFISYFHLRNLNDDRTWDRKMGASLVIWLLLYFILKRITELEPSLGVDATIASGFIQYISAMAYAINFYYIHLFIMLLVPIPFFRKGWQIAAIGIIVIVFIYLDQEAVSADADPFYNSMLTSTLIMMAVFVCFLAGLRLLLFPPPVDSTDEESLALRRSGYFALGTVAVVMDNMVFRSIGFFTGTGDTWWTFPMVNYSAASDGFYAGMITLIEMTFILGMFSFVMFGFAFGALFHIVQCIRKKQQTGLATVFSVYILVIWALIIFRHWAFVSEYAEWDFIGQPIDSNAEIISALSDGFTFHLIYPTIALLHAVKFGLITIESERDQKILRIVALGVMVAITAVFTSLLEIIIPVPDIVLAVLCALVLATGWEKKLIDALEPDEEMLKVSWAWPGDERKLLWGVNLMIGIPFVVALMAGVIW